MIENKNKVGKGKKKRSRTGRYFDFFSDHVKM